MFFHKLGLLYWYAHGPVGLLHELITEKDVQAVMGSGGLWTSHVLRNKGESCSGDRGEINCAWLWEAGSREKIPSPVNSMAMFDVLFKFIMLTFMHAHVHAHVHILISVHCLCSVAYLNWSVCHHEQLLNSLQLGPVFLRLDPLYLLTCEWPRFFPGLHIAHSHSPALTLFIWSLWPWSVFWTCVCLLFLYCDAQLLPTLAYFLDLLCLLSLFAWLSLVSACTSALLPSPSLVPSCFSILSWGLQPPATFT